MNKNFILLLFYVVTFVLSFCAGNYMFNIDKPNQDAVIERQSKTIKDQQDTIKRQADVIRDLVDRITLMQLD